MDRLSDILRAALEAYTGAGLNGYSYLTENTDGTVFTVVSVGQLPDKRVVDAGLIVRLVAGRIVVERDVNDKPLVDALSQAGIPRQQIVLACAGEPVEESAA
ncbi:MAG: XisI protein [Anaerolineaceae bacterium]|nr:XisI protein [Anaerolineaceae bacterium]